MVRKYLSDALHHIVKVGVHDLRVWVDGLGECFHLEIVGLVSNVSPREHLLGRWTRKPENHFRFDKHSQEVSFRDLSPRWLDVAVTVASWNYSGGNNSYILIERRNDVSGFIQYNYR